ncbi:hypothetical protein D3C87_1619350 [compost metagenome]
MSPPPAYTLPEPLPRMEPLAAFSVTSSFQLRIVPDTSRSPWRASICTASVAVMLFRVMTPVVLLEPVGLGN